MGSLRWDWYDWSLDVVVKRWPDGKPHQLRSIFSLRCGFCRAFTLGCGEHTFCGCCLPCLRDNERPGEDVAVVDDAQARYVDLLSR